MSQYTQKAILQTFQEMLGQMPFDKITVSALVAKCEISSNTFYYHYRDIYDLLDAWSRTMMRKCVEGIPEGLPWQDTLRAWLRVLLTAMQEHPAMVNHLLSSLSRERIERYIFESTDDTFYRLVRQATGGVEAPEELLRDVAEYNSYSFLGFILKFIWNDMKTDVEREVQRVSRIFEGSLQWLLTRDAPWQANPPLPGESGTREEPGP